MTPADEDAQEEWRLEIHATLTATDGSFDSWIEGPDGQTISHLQQAVEALNAQANEVRTLRAALEEIQREYYDIAPNRCMDIIDAALSSSQETSEA